MTNDVLRKLRLFHQWTQAELAERVCDQVERATGRRPSVDSMTISKLERGLISWPHRDSRQALREIFSVRSDADLGLYSKRTAKDAEAFYFGTRQETNSARKRASRQDKAVLSIEAALYQPSGQTRPLPVLRSDLARAEFAYRESQYASLGQRLPLLLDHARASGDAQILTDAYNLTTEFLIKQNLDDLTLVTTERSNAAASASGSSLAVAEAERMVCIALRHAGRRRTAYTLAVNAANQLANETALRTEHELAQYGALFSTAAYTAAVAERRARYWIDVARAYEQDDERNRTRDALRNAYAEAPQEVTARPAIALLARRVGFLAKT